VGLLTQGCDPGGTACLAYAVSSLSVTLVDATTREGLCGATVTASDGTFSERLLGFGTPCVYSGPYERPGSYSVHAEREGYLPARVDNVMVRLGPGPCAHVGTAVVIVALERR
jgi:hypothetical protein